jgi:hypothetical protein
MVYNILFTAFDLGIMPEEIKWKLSLFTYIVIKKAVA